MQDLVRSLARDIFDDVVRLRREFHAHPELSFQERETAGRIERLLTEIGLEVETGVGGTGVVGYLSGNSPGPCLALRADMDALPVHEETGLEFASREAGRMHACGHDVHMACLAGGAMILARLREHLSGSVRCIFQPAEERIPGGAAGMIKEGVLAARRGQEAVSTVLGLHVRPELPAATVGVRPGPFMAAADEVHIEVRGEGGHAAEAHRLRGDVVYAASQIVVSLQSVISRICPPDVPSILSLGRFIAEGATNIIPESVTIAGTFRSMDEEWRVRAHRIIRRVVEHTALAHGVVADCSVVSGYPVLANDADTTAWVQETAAEYLGEEAVRTVEPWFAGEDFAYFAREVPSCFWMLGVGKPGSDNFGLHTSRFSPDESALLTGSGLTALLALSYTGDRGR
jgi:hippurate hydrolase